MKTYRVTLVADIQAYTPEQARSIAGRWSTYDYEPDSGLGTGGQVVDGPNVVEVKHVA